MMDRDGFVVFEHDPRVAQWADAARQQVPDALNDPSIPRDQLRHGRTWFVGLDALNNDTMGRVDDVDLSGPWAGQVPDLPLHRAQVSIVYPGYPQQDADESTANHRFRVTRKAAHVDGLLPIGAEKRRFAKELHAYILAIPLNDCAAAPTVAWRGSHVIMQKAIAEAIGDADPRTVDVTEAYQTARRRVFDRCEMVALDMKVGQSALVHRFALHGTEVWDANIPKQPEGRMIAFFRPEFDSPERWLAAP